MGCHKCLLYTRMVFYLFTIAIHGGNSIFLLTCFDEEALKVKGIRDFYETQFYFFTCWTFIFQIGYACLAFLCDFMSLGDPTDKKIALPEFVTNFREKVFSVVVWPSALMVTSYFWIFYAYDRNLLYPEHFDLVITPTSNHIMHTLITPIALTELVLYPRRKPEGSVVPVCCVLGMEAVYVSTLFLVHYLKDIWVYPIFAKLNNNVTFLIVFLGYTACYLTVLYYVQFFVSSIVLRCWRKIGERFCKACKK